MRRENAYDRTDPLSIYKYAQELIGKTFRQICEEDDSGSCIINGDSSAYNAARANKKQKGGLGNLIEERFFHYPANDDSRPDFPEAGVELKVTPYKELTNGRLVAKERLIITMIDYNKVIDEDFEHSHLWSKSKRILLVYYLYAKEIANRLDYRINYVNLFTPPRADLEIIKHDFKVITDKIKAGKAHELSEADTLYLSAATKSSDSKVRRSQPYSGEPAKPRAFAFKNSYMTYVLNNYVIPESQKYETIMINPSQESFEEYVVNRVSRFRDWTVSQLCQELDIEHNQQKNLGAMIAFRILGVKGNHAEEFVKAGIVVKTIRVNAKGKIKENMSFPTFKFKELIKEQWEDSTFGNYLRETRFLFVVYREDDYGIFHLKGCQFWNMPVSDIENDVRSVWERTKKAIEDGLEIKIERGRNKTNLPKISENRVCHVRPHAQNKQDTYELPDGRHYPKQCFWLNNTYILSQLDEGLIGD